MDFPVVHSRKEKEILMKEIIQKLNITEPEKDIYTICLEVLEDDAFELFFGKILLQINKSTENISQNEPLNLILQ